MRSTASSTVSSTMSSTCMTLATSLFFTVLLSIFVSGCAEQESDSSGDNATYIETFPANILRKSSEDLSVLGPTNPSQAHLAFAFADYQDHAPRNENTLSAPFDLQQLLATLALGADGTTLDAFNAASGFDLHDVSTYAGISTWEQQVATLASVERQYLLWGQRGYRFAPAYLQAQAELFGPIMSGMEFLLDPSLSQSTINDVLEGELVMTEIGDRTRLVAAQTTTLETGWSSTASTVAVTGRFGEHETQRWRDMVRVSGQFYTAAGLNYQAVEVPLADPGLSMIMITPEPGTFDAIRDGLDAAFWNELRGSLATAEPTAETTVYIPHVELQRELPSNAMPDLGVALTAGSASTDPADPDTAANFSQVNNAGFLYLEKPRQHISFSIGEQGLNTATVTAAAQTATENEPIILFDPSYLGNNDYGVNFTMDSVAGAFAIFSPSTTRPCYYPPDQRPFLFAIYATETDTLLYLGQVRELDGPVVDPDWTAPYLSSSCGLSPPVDIYQYTGSVQCDSGSGTSIMEMGQILADAGIEFEYLNAYQSNDGNMYAAVCGGPDGIINVFTIQEHQLPLAIELGFHRLSDLNP